jgi:hypothetical protein
MTLQRAQLAGVACTLALIGAMAAHAAEGGAPDLSLTVAQLPIASGRAIARVAIHGQAPLHCAPEVGRIWLDDADFSVELKSPTQGCDDSRQLPFTLRVDPRASGLPLPSNRVVRVRVYRSIGATPVLRLVTHLDVDDAAIARVIEALRAFDAGAMDPD